MRLNASTRTKGMKRALLLILLALVALSLAPTTAAKKPRPDLGIDKVALNGTKAGDGVYDVTVTALVVNTGEARAKPTWLQVTIGAQTKEAKIPKLKKGGLFYATLTFTLAEGPHMLTATADGRERRKESDESNNGLSTTISVPFDFL